MRGCCILLQVTHVIRRGRAHLICVQVLIAAVVLEASSRRPMHALSEVALLGRALEACASCRGLCPRTPRIYRLLPLPMLGLLQDGRKRGCRTACPFIDRSRPPSRRSGCFPALPYLPLSPDSFYFGAGYTEAILVVGSEGMTLKPWGKWSKRRITFPPRRYSAC